MRKTIATIGLCIFVMTNLSCRCDIEEDEAENKITDSIYKPKKQI